MQLPAIAAQQARNFSDEILHPSEDAEAVYNSASRVSRILLVTPQPFYEDRGTPIAVQYVARALGQLGFNVDILALPVGEDVSLPRTRIRRCANPFHIRSVPIGFSWRKVVMDLSLWRSFDRLLATRQYDLVHAVEDAAYIASIVCPRYQQPFIYDMASAIPLELQRKALFRGAMARRFITAAERRVFRRASHVVCSAGLAKYVNSHYPKVSVSEWCFPAVTQHADLEGVESLRRELGIPMGHRVLLYSGNFASYQGIDLLIDAFRIARERKGRLSLVCVGATAAEIRALSTSRARDLAQVHLVPRQPRDAMPAYLDLADYLVSPRARGGNLPLKLFDYMASGKPIIATRGAAHQPLLDSGRAFLADPNPHDLAEAIVKAFESPVESHTVSRRALGYAAQHLSWDQFVQFVGNMYGDVMRDYVEERRQVA